MPAAAGDAHGIRKPESEHAFFRITEYDRLIGVEGDVEVHQAAIRHVVDGYLARVLQYTLVGVVDPIGGRSEIAIDLAALNSVVRLVDRLRSLLFLGPVVFAVDLAVGKP